MKCIHGISVRKHCPECVRDALEEAKRKSNG